jgi:hypothetical protein
MGNLLSKEATSSQDLIIFDAEQFCVEHSLDHHLVILQPSGRGNQKIFICQNADCVFSAIANKKEGIWSVTKRSRLNHQPKSIKEEKRKMDECKESLPTKIAKVPLIKLSILDRARVLRLRGYLLLSIKKHAIDNLLLARINPIERLTSGKTALLFMYNQLIVFIHRQFLYADCG